MTPTKAYNVLHLRVEDDWVSHCKRWEHVGDGERVLVPLQGACATAGMMRSISHTKNAVI